MCYKKEISSVFNQFVMNIDLDKPLAFIFHILFQQLISQLKNIERLIYKTMVKYNCLYPLLSYLSTVGPLPNGQRHHEKQVGSLSYQAKLDLYR